MDVGLPVAVHPLHERDAAYKTKLSGWVGGITLDRGRGRNRCVDVGLLVAVCQLCARDARDSAYKATLTGWVGRWYHTR